MDDNFRVSSPNGLTLMEIQYLVKPFLGTHFLSH